MVNDAIRCFTIAESAALTSIPASQILSTKKTRQIERRIQGIPVSTDFAGCSPPTTFRSSAFGTNSTSLHRLRPRLWSAR
jgi:hypothetical protein